MAVSASQGVLQSSLMDNRDDLKPKREFPFLPPPLSYLCALLCGKNPKFYHPQVMAKTPPIK